MPEETAGQSPLIKELEDRPDYNQEIVQYQNNQLALRLSGDAGAQFNFDLHKYSPTKQQQNEAIISTRSGNEYYIFSLRIIHT